MNFARRMKRFCGDYNMRIKIYSKPVCNCVSSIIETDVKVCLSQGSFLVDDF